MLFPSWPFPSMVTAGDNKQTSCHFPPEILHTYLILTTRNIAPKSFKISKRSKTNIYIRVTNNHHITSHNNYKWPTNLTRKRHKVIKSPYLTLKAVKTSQTLNPKINCRGKTRQCEQFKKP